MPVPLLNEFDTFLAMPDTFCLNELLAAFATPAFCATAPTEALRPTADSPVVNAPEPIDSNAAFASASVVALAAADIPCATPLTP